MRARLITVGRWLLGALAWCTRPLVRTVDRRIALAIFVGVSLLMLLTADMGFVRDEGYYFKAGRDYIGWFDQAAARLGKGDIAGLADTAALKRHFDYNREHPGLVKLAMGACFKVFHQWLGLLSIGTAMRVPGFLFSGLACALLYLLGVAVFNRRVGALAAALFILTPRTFFHGHLGAFDMPITAMTVAMVMAYRASLRRARWVWLGGLVWGLALVTKHNAAFLPLFFLVHYGYTALPRLRLRRDGGHLLELPPLPALLWGMLLVAPLVVLALYPSLWINPAGRLYEYYSYHSHHEHYPVEIFGTLYESPPFPLYYPFLMTAITAPLPLVLFGVVGLVATVPAALWFPLLLGQRVARWLQVGPPLHVIGRTAHLASLLWRRSGAPLLAWTRRQLAVPPAGLATRPASGPVALPRARDDQLQRGDRSRRPGPSPSDQILILGSALWPMVLIALPTVPIFGGVKHWMPAMPFLALLAAWQIDRLSLRLWAQAQQHLSGRMVLRRLARLGGASALFVLMAHLAVLPGVIGTAYSHPVQTAFFNSLVMGVQGGAGLGMARTFWGHDARPLFPALNAAVEQGTVRYNAIYADRLNYDSFKVYHEDALLSRKLHYRGGFRGNTRFAIITHMKEFNDNEFRLWTGMATQAPRWMLTIDEVPIVSIYERGWWPGQ